MVAPGKRILTVQSDGTLDVRAAGLRPGSRAEVIALTWQPTQVQEAGSFFADFALDELAGQQGISGTPTFKQIFGGWPKEELNDGFERMVRRWRRTQAASSKQSRR